MVNGIALRRFAGHAAHVDALDGPVRVVHLTDQHVGRVTPIELQMQAVAVANAEKPDLIALTGDFVCHGLAYLDDLAEVIRAFQAPVFAVLGNHDYWSGGEAVAHTLEKAGACVLRNGHTSLTVGHQRVQIVGVDDAYTGHADVERAARGIDRGLPTIGLSHIAEEADHLWHCGVPFVLSGHTHGGQITIGRIHELVAGRIAGHRYVHGLYGERRGDGAVYVGAGIGAAVMPVRLGMRGQREVTVFDLGMEPASFDEHHGEQVPLPGRKPSPELKARRKADAYRRAARHGHRPPPPVRAPHPPTPAPRNEGGGAGSD
jgi:hypothetical protein